MKLSNRATNIIAATLLMIMFCSAFFSIKGMSATMDELAHISAGYSYLSQKDFRINPEHPPLAKDLAAVPLLFLDLNFPIDHPSWQEKVNGQWWLGSEFLYKIGNDADQVIFWSRLPMILLLIFLGWFLFKWTKELYGNKTALFALTFFSFSPTFIAHGRLVTTDIAAAVGILIATYFWLKFLKESSKKNIILAGLIFGVAMLLKFSLVLLIPFFAIITLTYAWLNKPKPNNETKKCNIWTANKQIFKYIGLAVLVGIIGVIFVIWPVYQLHVLNYPAERQLSDTQNILASSSMGPLDDLCIWMSDKPILRSISHYFLGLLMVTQRTAGGNTVYFMGIISNSGWWYYFPTVYLLKMPLAFHILTLIALLSSLYAIKRPFWIESKKRLKAWILNNFTEFSMLVFLAIYWFTSISGNLNIGVRHILPVFPFIYILVSAGIANWTKTDGKNFPKTKMMKIIFLAFLFSWYMLSSLSAFPHYLSYFNEIVGGSKTGYKYVVDSNYDWGQDLKRLTYFVENPPTGGKIEKIYVDYFGGGDPSYYLKEKYIPYNPFEETEKPKGWFAVSATLLQGGRGNPAPGFKDQTRYYQWLAQYQPVARAGNSIFIYYID